MSSLMRQDAIDALTKGSHTTFRADAVSDETPLSAGGLGLSSIALLQAFVCLEERFSFSFDDAAVLDATFLTVGDFRRASR